MKATHIVINKNHGTNWNVGSKIVLCRLNDKPMIDVSGQAIFTDTTGTVSVTANMSEVEEL